MQPDNLGHLFEDQAKFYAQFRPSYPPELYEAVYGLAKLPRRGTALDVATGSGQVAKVLANDFETVIGTDSSAGQLREAVRHPKITYQHVPAEDLQGVSDASVDLATVAEAFHWFDRERFFQEMRRVLKSDGVLAIWGYDFGYLEPGSAAQGSIPDSDVAAANAAFTEFHSGTEGLGPYWAPGRALVEAWYAGLEPGSSHFKDVTWLPEGMAIREDMSLDHLVGLLNSWSALTTYRKQHPEKADLLAAFKATMARCFSIEDAEAPNTIRMVRNIFGFVAKEPQPLVR